MPFSTLAAARMAALDMSGSSVLTAVRVMVLAFSAASTVHAMSGLPPSGARFLPGRRLLLDFAGMTASTFALPPFPVCDVSGCVLNAVANFMRCTS